MLKRIKEFWALAVAAMLLSGCASMGVEAPKEFNDRVAVGVMSATTSLQTITVLVNAEKLTPDEGIQMVEGVHQAKVALQGLRAVWKTDPLDAENKLGALLAVLQQVDFFLKKRGQS
jgi:hypothetical protein